MADVRAQLKNQKNEAKTALNNALLKRDAAERRTESYRAALAKIERLADALSHSLLDDYTIQKAEGIEDLARAALAETKEGASNE